MQRDEMGTLSLVRADFDRMRDQCARHEGEVLKSTGDGLLMCFSSVVQAVACALAMQAVFSGRAPDTLRHRMGVHLGDVFREGDDVAGDGVNIAARLQTKARPGTVCISQSVYDAVKGKLAMQVEPLGPQSFKNITEPLRVYLVTPEGGMRPPAIAHRRSWFWPVAIGVVSILAGLAVVFWPKSAPVPAPPTSVVLDKSIAVLPFTNMSDNKDDAFFSDGIHEDILTNLANIGELKVISRTSVMQYRGTTRPLRQIAADLGVAYVLEGSVRRAGNQVRVTGQLINARTDEHVWAKAYDRELKDIFALQSELAAAIAGALQAAISPGERSRLEARPTDNIAAYELYLNARTLIRDTNSTREMMERAQPLLEQAVAMDPHFALAWAELGLLRMRVYLYLERTKARLAQAEDAIGRAAEFAPNSLLVLWAQQEFHRMAGEEDRMAPVVARITELYPNRAETFIAQASLAWARREWRKAVENYQRALVLDPHGEDCIRGLAQVLFYLRRYDEVGACNARLEAIHPLSVSQHFQWAMLPFLKSGDIGPVERFLAGLPSALTDPGAVWPRARWLFTKGDAPGLIQLWRESGVHWRFSTVTNRLDLVSVAASFLKLGQPEQAKPLLEKNRDQLIAQLNEEPDNQMKLCDLALVHAMLGEREAAHRVIDQERALLAHSDDATAVAQRTDVALVLLWLGAKDETFAIMADQLRRPENPNYGNIHEMERGTIWWPLQDDPRLAALVADPLNNAPLLLP
ncbi:MAG: Tetratricopeptide repeat protein [Lacunisphaera sp.]|nr:Tetratricopeptide repeat protein [Lacunisphaera sp.]